MAINFPVAWANSAITASNALTTTAAQVIGKNTQRIGITFHNPGSVAAYVCPAQVSSAALASLGGCFVVLPQSDITLYGGNTISSNAINGPWLAFSASSSNNPLTVMEYLQ